MTRLFGKRGMIPLRWLGLTALALALTAAGPAAAGQGDKKPARRAILLVTFGTSVPQAQKVFAGIEEAVRRAHPGMEVRWAYTSAKIRAKLAKTGQRLDSPEEALARLMAQDYDRVAVQSLHVIPGAEYSDLAAVVRGFANMEAGFRPSLGLPLCATTDDLQVVCKAVLADLPAGRRPGEAVIFMGHGTHHPAGVVYPALAYILGKSDPLAFMATVEGYPELDAVMGELKAKGVTKAWLVPFMTVAGDHAMNDMAGDEPDSWKMRLKAAGVEAVPVMRAISENPAIVAVWLRHLDACLKTLD